jgi:hypothetical protein
MTSSSVIRLLERSKRFWLKFSNSFNEYFFIFMYVFLTEKFFELCSGVHYLLPKIMNSGTKLKMRSLILKNFHYSSIFHQIILSNYNPFILTALKRAFIPISY